MMKKMDLTFLGAAGTVTGSKYLLTCNGRKVLIDCGLFQGTKSLRLKNWNQFPVKATELDAIILTHAHIDHSGYIPRLIKEGFSGKIYSTAATKEVCEILLPDSGYLMEEEAEYLNRRGKTKHSPALPLFTQEDAERSIEYFVTVPFRQKQQVTSELSFEFRYAGHILGAASIVAEAYGRKICFSGDVGRLEDRIFHPPEPLPNIDYLVTESTYGNRLHKDVDSLDELEKVVNDTVAKKGVILIPSFAVGRAQAIMHALAILRRQKRIPEIPMYLNSPMATKFGSIFCKYNDLHKLSKQECEEVDSIVKYIRTVEESKELNDKKGPMLIISASGMLTGGRILHHLKAFAPFPETTIILTGFQAGGTRGDALLRGADEIKIHGQFIPVKAQTKILGNMSAHADYGELIQWFKQSNIRPSKVFVTHGESSAAEDFGLRLQQEFSWKCFVPRQDEVFDLV